MSINEILDLHSQGRIKEAYEAARIKYAKDKGQDATNAMFWTAVDMLKFQVKNGLDHEASKIYEALERLVHRPTIASNNTQMLEAMKACHQLLTKPEKRERLQQKEARHLQLGVWGEEVAVSYLLDKGYVILERDWHSNHRDIDIVAFQDGCLVFVEVKTRRNDDFADPLLSINYPKRKNLQQAIHHYLRYRKTDDPWRFDVITIIGEYGCSAPVISHIEDFSLR